MLIVFFLRHHSNLNFHCWLQVPSAGILSNGTAYIFYKCQHASQQDGQPFLACSEFMIVELHKGITAQLALQAVMKVLKTMVQLFVDQKEALRNFRA